MSKHAGCVYVAAVVMREVKTFKLFICHQGLALYLVFLPRGKKLDVVLVRIHSQNESDILLILYMACVSGIVSSRTLIFFCTSLNSCLASLSCWSQCCSPSAVCSFSCAVSDCTICSVTDKCLFVFSSSAGLYG